MIRGLLAALLLPTLGHTDVVFDPQAADNASQFYRAANEYVSCLFIRQEYLLRQGERNEATIIRDSTAMCKVAMDAWVEGFNSGVSPKGLEGREYSAARNVLKIITSQTPTERE